MKFVAISFRLLGYIDLDYGRKSTGTSMPCTAKVRH